MVYGGCLIFNDLIFAGCVAPKDAINNRMTKELKYIS